MTTTQASLFDRPVDDDRPGGVRRTDPLPSRLVAANRTLRIKWSSDRCKLLGAYAEAPAGGTTDDRAGQAAGVERYTATKRISELLKSGLLVDTKVYGNSLKGNTARKCVITAEGRAALAKAMAK